MLAKFSERIGCQAKSLEHGAVLYRIKDNMIVGAVLISHSDKKSDTQQC